MNVKNEKDVENERRGDGKGPDVGLKGWTATEKYRILKRKARGRMKRS